jgi:NADH-quinone oxidoreductase subunit M
MSGLIQMFATSGSGTADLPYIALLVGIPAIGALLVTLLPSSRPELAKFAGATITLVVAALAAVILADFDKSEAGYQFVSQHRWIEDLGISWKVGIDGISLWLVVLTAWLFPIALLAPKVERDVKAYVAWILLLEAGCLGVFCALDLFLFFIFWEIVLVPMYFLIGGWGHGRRTYAALKFFIYTALGSALMLVAIIALASLSATGGRSLTFDLEELASRQGVLSIETSRWLFAAFALSFGIKVPLFPFHTWLPDAHTEAPTAGSVILAGVMLKLGTYGFIRFGLELFPQAASDLAPVFLTMATIGIIYGALVATVQKDLKRLVAYSSVAHLGFIVLGIFALTRQGLVGGVLQMVNHGVSTGALFLLVGMIYERRHTREISQLRGLGKAAPVLGGVFTLVMLSSIGVPGLNGFVGEFLTLAGTFLTRRWWAVVAASGVILAAIYLLWAYQRTFHGEPDEANQIADMSLWERVVMAPLILAIVVMGVYPKPFIDRIEPSVNRVLAHVEASTSAKEPEVARDGVDASTVPEPVDAESVDAEAHNGDEGE